MEPTLSGYYRTLQVRRKDRPNKSAQLKNPHLKMFVENTFKSNDYCILLVDNVNDITYDQGLK